MRLLGVALMGQGKFEEAKPLLLDGYAGIKDDPRAPEDFKRRALENLVNLYEAWDKPEPAAEWRAELQQWRATTQPAASQLADDEEPADD